MLEKFLFDAEKEARPLRIFVGVCIITCVAGVINYFLGGNALFLVALVALAICAPLTNYIWSMDKEEIETQLKENELIYRHEKELVVFWSAFAGIVLGMFLLGQGFFLGPTLINDFTYQQAFVNQISGHATQTQGSFASILINNIGVLLFTFIVCLFSLSGLMLVIVWNASIVSYYLLQLGSTQMAAKHAFLLLGHGLLEIGGYVLVGIAGSLISYKTTRGHSLKNRLDVMFWKDFTTLVVMSIVMIVLGAVLEVL